MEARASERVRAFRSRRDAGAVERALQSLDAALAGTENLVPPVLVAVEAGATIGEIMARAEARYGTFLAPAGLPE
jgi:methylmalonyl-CoA mutase N-terminal domain/subunit